MLKIGFPATASHIEAGEPGRYIGQTVRVRGVVYKIRKMSGFAFVILSSRSGLLQCVYSPECSRFALGELCEGMGIEAEGEVVRDAGRRAGAELRLASFRELSRPALPAPVVINGKQLALSLDTLLELRPITLRHERERAIFRVQAALCRGLRAFLDSRGFTEIHSPKIVSAGAEGGANIFALDYFGRRAYLAQSPQFYKQIMVGVFERVYEIAPVFRAEKHDTSRHLNEYTSVDLEMGFIDSFYDICRLQTQMLAETFGFVREKCEYELELLGARVPDIAEIPALRFDEAKQMISRAYSREITDFEDFEPEEERLLCELIEKETGCELVFVTHYRASKRPFYAMDTPGEPAVTESFDLLFRGMEITTGGQRINDYAAQTEKMRARGMNVEDFGEYLLAHRHGLPPHGGLGMGLERLTARLLNLANIRRATLFPR